MKFGVREKEVLGGEKTIGIERDREKWGPNHADPIYRISVILDRLIGVKSCRALKGSIDTTIE